MIIIALVLSLSIHCARKAIVFNELPCSNIIDVPCPASIQQGFPILMQAQDGKKNEDEH